MTCIVAIADGKGKVFMGADTYGSGPGSGTYVGNPKCFINGDFLIGCTSTFRIIDLLAYKLSVPQVHPDHQEDPDKYMRTVFIDSVKKCFKESGHLRVDSGVEYGGNFLVGYRGKVYEIQSDFSVLNVPDYGGSVGSGESAARGSLYTTKDSKMKASDKIRTALEAAVEVVPSVRGPFVFLENS